jgi:aryl-alcohol dehydrogenase-like predicted oxidoreductase
MKNKIKNNTSKIVYGCMGGSGAFGPVEEKQSIEALQVAFDEGVTFFDTAEMYGDGYSEQLLAKAMNNKRKEITIISKVSPEHLSKKKLKESCERSLKNLKTDYIDIYLVHWPNREIPFSQYIEALTELKQEGKILSYGVSNFGVKDLDDIYQLDNNICVDEVCYNLFTRAAEFELIPSCKEKDIPIFTYSSLMQGLLTGRYKHLDDFPDNRARMHLFDSRKRTQSRHGGYGQEAIAQKALDQIFKIASETGISLSNLAIGWLKSKSAVSGVIIGTKNAEQSHNLRNFINLELDSEVVKKLDDATLDLRNALEGNIDPWDFRTR